ncbi:NADPH-dependent F420 reductase [Hugenholtzia roseola]|uniref:NADPH-dependent F420 reductase n=1 Tax=Hugenholtzia roseola TaxID=1002 RepID=UPI0003F5ED04|nr:NAD(P)-binding domain-containing protein [Hugenholtzia roseola]
MKISIIGTGNVGGALATQWAKAGHQIFLGTRELAKFEDKHLLENPNTTLHTIAESAANAEVILVAAVPPATQSIAEEIKAAAKGKVLIDAMNAITTRPEGFSNSFEAFRHYLPETEVVKCFNSTGFENMKNPIYQGEGIDMFAAGSSKKAKEVATQLALDAGFSTCWDFGGDDKAALLEQFALSWINLAIMQGHGRNIAFKLIKR